MEKIIETFFNESEKARDFQTILGYQWAILAGEQSERNLLDDIILQKSKGA